MPLWIPWGPECILSIFTILALYIWKVFKKYFLLTHWAKCPGKNLAFSETKWAPRTLPQEGWGQSWNSGNPDTAQGQIISKSATLRECTAHCCSWILTSQPRLALAGKPGTLDVIFWDVNLTLTTEEQRAILPLLWEAVEVEAKGWFTNGWPDHWLDLWNKCPACTPYPC